MSTTSVIKSIASKRVSDLEEWHQNSLDIFSRHLSDHERSVIAKCFQGGLVLMSGALPSLGGVISLTTDDTIFVTEVMDLLRKTPRAPHSRFVSRYVYVPNSAAIMSASQVPFPPVPGSVLPHMLPFASTLREGFAMYWTHRTDLLKKADKVESPCCVLRIRVPRGTPSFFWGPTAVPTPASVSRMGRGLFKKGQNQFEVLLPPANLRVKKVHTRNLNTTMEHIPEYTHHVPDLSLVKKTFGDVPVYECDLEPIEIGLLITESKSSATKILGIQGTNEEAKMKGPILLIAKEHLHPDIAVRVENAIKARKAKWVPLSVPGREVTAQDREPMDPTSIIFEDKVNYTKAKKHLVRLFDVLRVFNKYNPSRVTKYPVEEAEEALHEKDTYKLRSIVGTFYSDLMNNYKGFEGYFFSKASGDLMTEMYHILHDYISDIDEYENEFETALSLLIDQCDGNMMFRGSFDKVKQEADAFSSWKEYYDTHSTTLHTTLDAFWKRLKAFDKDVRSARRYLMIDELYNFRYGMRGRITKKIYSGLEVYEQDRIEAARQEFITKVAPHFAPYTKKHNILGVSFVPIHNNKVVLGKEKAGVYKNKYNYFGGKILDKAAAATPETVAEVLFEECYEEMGIILTPEMFQQSVTKTLIAPFKNLGASIILVAQIRGITPAWWRSIFVHRTEEECEWKYREMSCVQQFDITAIKKGTYVLKSGTSMLSDYVQQTVSLLSQQQTTPTKKPSDIHTFATLSIRDRTKKTYLSP